MAFVRQRNTKDCRIAVVAMIANATYEEAETECFRRKEEFMIPHAVFSNQGDISSVVHLPRLHISDFNQRRQPMELMFDLETLDITSQAIVLSVGAVAFRYVPYATPVFDDSFYAVIEIDPQVRAGRTISQSTLLWWMDQGREAQKAAFDPQRAYVRRVLIDLNRFVRQYDGDREIKRFWAGPATFDFPIWESLVRDFTASVPWRYNQMRDLKTIVEASGISIDSVDSKMDIEGVLHHPVFDCQRQINLLAAARNALKK